MTNQTAPQSVQIIERLLDRIEEIKKERLALEKKLQSKLKEYKIALQEIEYWEKTGLEQDIDELQSRISGMHYQISQLELKLDKAELF